MLLKKHWLCWWLLCSFVVISCTGELEGSLDFTEESNANAITTEITSQTLPETVINYIRTHFTETTILQSFRHQHGTSISYGVIIQTGELLLFAPNGVLLALDQDGVEEGTDQDGQEISASQLPVSIIQYILEHYPTAIILFVEKENGGEYEIYLDNEVELHFDEAGNFISEENDNDDDGVGELEEDDDDGEENENDDDDDDDNNTDDDDE